MRVTMRMPSKKQYNLVTNDELDTRVPLHPDEAFTHGIKFSAKYIGTLDVPRPTSRVEIVAAMRRIRYEFKAKGIKKKKISLEISVDGVKISIRKKKKQQPTIDDSQLLIMSHPIYRIFYVSHDSQDLKIFSYIARDAASNVFRCHVFKANKKNQAMRVVRTIGQAFEVCHKMAVKDKSPSPEPHGDDISREGSEDSSDKPKRDGLDSESGQEDLMTLTSDTFNDDGPDNLPSRPFKLEPLAPPIGSDILKKGVGETFTSPLSEPLPTGDFLPQAGTPLSVHHELQLLREQLEQQQQQTQAAVAQVHLLRDQLAAETAARLEAQARTHQLLVHNKELLEHIQQLVLQVRDLEVKIQGGNSSGGGGVSGAIPMPPNLPETKHEESHLHAALQQNQQRQHLQEQQRLQHQHQSSLQSMQQQLRQRDFAHLQQWQQGPQWGEEGSSTVSLSSDSDLKKDSSGQSSGESVTAAIAQLYSIDPRRLPQVPEDSVPITQFGTGAMGTQRFGLQRGPLNGPITRAASERYSRQETLAQMQRMEWARHTTK